MAVVEFPVRNPESRECPMLQATPTHAALQHWHYSTQVCALSCTCTAGWGAEGGDASYHTLSQMLGLQSLPHLPLPHRPTGHPASPNSAIRDQSGAHQETRCTPDDQDEKVLFEGPVILELRAAQRGPQVCLPRLTCLFTC